MQTCSQSQYTRIYTYNQPPLYLPSNESGTEMAKYGLLFYVVFCTDWHRYDYIALYSTSWFNDDYITDATRLSTYIPIPTSILFSLYAFITIELSMWTDVCETGRVLLFLCCVLKAQNIVNKHYHELENICARAVFAEVILQIACVQIWKIFEESVCDSVNKNNYLKTSDGVLILKQICDKLKEQDI